MAHMSIICERNEKFLILSMNVVMRCDFIDRDLKELGLVPAWRWLWLWLGAARKPYFLDYVKLGHGWVMVMTFKMVMVMDGYGLWL